MKRRYVLAEVKEGGLGGDILCCFQRINLEAVDLQVTLRDYLPLEPESRGSAHWYTKYIN